MLKQLVDRLGTTHVAGIDLGSAKLKIVELARGADNYINLRRCVVVDTLSDGPSLAQLLTEAGISTRNVAIGIASPELVVKPLKFPHMPKKELASAIRLEAEQSILNGHTIEQMTIDWHVLPSQTRDDLRGVLAVVPKSLMTVRSKLFAAAGLRPVVIDVEGLALWNAYWTLVGAQQAAGRTVLLMNVGAQTTNLVVVKGQHELLLMRDLRLGAVALEAGQGAEWSTEIHDSLAYARANGGLRTLDAVYVTGGGSGPNLIPLLRSAVAAPVTFWNPLQQLALDPLCPPIDPSVGPLLAVAIGLALGSTDG